MILADNGSAWYLSGRSEPRLGQRRPALAPRRARQRVRGRRHERPAATQALASADATRQGRLLRLELRRLARSALYPEGMGPARWLQPLRRGVRHRGGQLDLLPASFRRRRGALGGADAAGLRLRGQGQPLPDPRSPAARRGRRRASCSSSGSSRSCGRGSSGRWCGSCRRTSAATTSGWRRPWAPCRRAGTASSSATRAGSPSPCTSLLREHDAALVIGDHPRWPFQERELTTDWTLVRLHHGARGRRGNYSATRARGVGGAHPGLAPAGRGVRLLQQRLGGLRRGERHAGSSGFCGLLQAAEGAAQQP